LKIEVYRERNSSKERHIIGRVADMQETSGG
jgi:hypothetical protein